MTQSPSPGCSPPATRTQPLHYVLLHYWMLAFGDSEAAVRSLSALFGILLVLVVYGLGVELAGRRVGLIAALLAAVSPFYVQRSQEGRMYILAALLTGLSFLAFLRARREPTRGSVLVYVAATALLLYTHVYGLFILLVQVIVVAVDVVRSPAGPPRRSRVRLWVTAQVAVLALYAPWAYVFARQAREEIQGGPAANLAWLAPPSPTDVVYTFKDYVGSGYALLVVALIVAAAILAGGRGEAVRRLRGSPMPFLGLWLGVPILVPFIISITVRPMYQSKYTIPASLAFFLALAIVLARSLDGWRLRAAAAAAAIALLVATIPTYAREKEDWRGAVGYVESTAKPGDVVAFDADYLQELTFDYYATRPDLREIPAKGGLPPATSRVWLVVSHSDDPGRYPAAFQRVYGAPVERRFKGVHVFLFDRSG